MDSDTGGERLPAARAASKTAIFDAPYYRGVLVETAGTAAALAAFFFSGASRALAEGATRFAGGRWWLANALYLGVATLGVAAAFFPLHCARARRLSRAALGPRDGDAGWFGLYLRAVLGDGAHAFAFFNAIYALLHWTPHRWWLIAAGLYAALTVVAPALLPWLVQARLYHPQPVADPDVERAVLAVARRAGRPLEAVGAWTEEDSAEFPDALLAGFRRRRMVLGAAVAAGGAPAEAATRAARELGRARRRYVLARIGTGTAVAVAGFAAVQYGALAMLRRLGPLAIAEARDLAGFPLLALAILAASALAQPVLRAHRRSQVYAADAFAARLAGPAALATALRRRHGAAPPRPRWVELLFDDTPSIQRRLARLERGG